jgi:hypothetical protein
MQQSKLSRGVKYANEYLLTPYAFKLCLIRAKNSKIYANYYLLLERVFKYYKEYQTSYQEKIINIKDDKINQLLKSNEEIKKQNDKQSEKIDKLLNYSKDIKNQNEDLKDDITYLNENINDVRYEFRENLEHLNLPPKNENNLHMFVLLQYKNSLYEFRIERGQQKKFQKNKYNKEYNIIIDKTYNPNPIDLFVLIKDKIRELNLNIKQEIRNNYKNKIITLENKNNLLHDHIINPPIKVKYNNISINNNKYSLNELIELINKCDNKRRETFIP